MSCGVAVLALLIAAACAPSRQTGEVTDGGILSQLMRGYGFSAAASSFRKSVRGVSFIRNPLRRKTPSAVRSGSSGRAHASSGGEGATAGMESKLPAGKTPKEVTEGEWKTILSPEQFRILRMKGTEYPGTGEYNKFYPKEGDGIFKCAGCGADLYTAKSKFDSGCGWPAFYEGVPGAILEVPDKDGMRTEIVCAKCGGHLGHVFKNEGFRNPTNERHCVNSVSIEFKASK